MITSKVPEAVPIRTTHTARPPTEPLAAAITRRSVGPNKEVTQRSREGVLALGEVVVGSLNAGSAPTAKAGAGATAGAAVAAATGAPNPACRLDESTVGPGDGVGPAAFDAGAGVAALGGAFAGARAVAWS